MKIHKYIPLFLIFLLSVSFSAGLGITYDPNNVELNPGETATFGIRVVNYHPITIVLDPVMTSNYGTAVLSKTFNDPTGNLIGVTETDEGKYIITSKQRVELEYSITVPEDAQPWETHTIKFDLNVQQYADGDSNITSVTTISGGQILYRYTIVPVTKGDGICQSDENCELSPEDCKCLGICDPSKENVDEKGCVEPETQEINNDNATDEQPNENEPEVETETTNDNTMIIMSLLVIVIIVALLLLRPKIEEYINQDKE